MGSASLQWSSYLGGNSIDHGYGIAVRGTAVYVVGTSFSVNFPTTEGSFERSADDDPATRDGVIAKIELGLPSPSTAASARYVYDAEGNRAKRTLNGVTTIYVGGFFEREGTSTRKSYYFGGQLVAVRQHGVLSYLLSDHLGSTSVTLDVADLHGETVHVAVLETGSNGRPYVRVVTAKVLRVDQDTIEFDYPVDRGDSGGGIFIGGLHIGNTWYRRTGITYQKACHNPLPCLEIPIGYQVAGVGALN